MQEFYFDNAATTKPSETALKAAINAASEVYGNPSSRHFMGVAAKRVIENARAQVASVLGCTPEELIFTSSGSESNNQAIIGAARSCKRRSNIIVSTDSEHPSVENTLVYLESEGFQIIRLSTKGGKINKDELKKALSQKVALVTVMHANNETGALYDLAEIRNEIDCSGCGALFHSDAVQSFLKTPVRTELVRNCDLVSISAHKINALKGCGGLYIKKGTNIPTYIFGGGQESGLRSGTENTPAIAAFGAECAEWAADRERAGYIATLRDYTQNAIKERLADRVRFHIPYKRICGILSMELIGVRSEVALNYLSGEGICISAGSACSSHRKDTRVLTAFGLDRNQTESTLRISFGLTNNLEETEKLVEALERASHLDGKI